jgi:hypothetical protein
MPISTTTRFHAMIYPSYAFSAVCASVIDTGGALRKV